MQKTASLNFCASCRIFKHFPSTDNKEYDQKVKKLMFPKVFFISNNVWYMKEK